MGFLERFGRSEGGGRTPSPFEPWSPPPPIHGIAAGRRADMPALSSSAVGRANPVKYSPALIIGLGPTGETVLRALVEEMTLDPAGPQSRLQFILLTERTSSPWPAGGLVRRFALATEEPTLNQSRAVDSARAPLLERFLHPSFYDGITSYLSGVQKDLRAGAAAGQETTVIIIGSLAEAESGLVGNLMLLLQATGDGRGISNRMVMLGLESAAPRLSAEEQAVALSELSRLTFHGPHVMPASASQPDNTASDALIDYLMLIEYAGGLSRSPEAGAAVPEMAAVAVGQAIAETTYLLLHPAGETLWEELKNNLNSLGDARRRTHIAYVTGVGVATLFVPVIELQAYIAARLAQAAVFGELPYAAEGLLARRTPAVSHQAAGPALARGWLQGAPFPHRLLSGLLETTGPDSFGRLPHLSTHMAELVPLLPAQTAHHLVALLNDGQPDPLERAEAGLVQMQRYLDQWIAWCRAATSAQADELRTLLHILEQWRGQIGSLYDQLLEWRRAIGADAATADTAGGRPPATLRGLPLGGLPLGDPQQPPADFAPPPPLPGMRPAPAGPPLNNPARSVPVGPSLRELLTKRRRAAERGLQDIVGGAVRRPLTAKQTTIGYDGLQEAEKYYGDTIRPELIEYIRETGVLFGEVTRRLYWWIRLTRSAPPELLLICLPIDAALPATATTPPETAVFRPPDTERLANTLLAIAAAQAQKTAEHLTAGWMVGRLQKDENHAFLTRAQPVFLDYDAAQARDLYLDTLSIRPYLLGPDNSALDAVAGHIFPAAVESAVTRINSSEPTRLSSLLFQTAIPLSSLRRPQSVQRSNQTDSLFLYQQERLAAQYEAQMRNQTATGRHFPPDFVVALTRPDLVRLFFQGILAGLVAVRVIDPIRGDPEWTAPYDPAGAADDSALLPWESREFKPGSFAAPMPEIDSTATDDFALSQKYLQLAAYRPSDEWASLWAAMRAFTLELPFGRSLDANPIHPFHRANQSRFLQAMGAAISATVRREEGYRAMRRRAESLRARLPVWRSQADDDTLAQAFFTVLELETRRSGNHL